MNGGKMRRLSITKQLLLLLLVFIGVVSLLYWLMPISFFKSLPSHYGNNNTQEALKAFNRAEQYHKEGNAFQAANWYQKAALSGSIQAQLKLAKMYREGQGVSQDLTLAAHWLTEAAMQDQVDAQLKLARMYFSGGGVKQDFTVAAQWYSKAAHQGQVEAQFELGIMYRDGKGVLPDDRKAMHWLKKAAEQKHTEAKLWVEKMQSQVPNLMEAENFQQAYQLASQFEIPEMQKLAARAKKKMEVALAELQFLYAKADYEGVITQGTPKIGYGEDIQKLVEQAKTVQTARKKVSQLIDTNQFQAAYELANQFENNDLQASAIYAKSQVDAVLTELQYLYAKGDYDGVIQKGTPKVAFSNEIKKIVEQTHQQYTLVKREQLKTELLAARDKKPSQNITIAVIGDSLAMGVWAAIYRRLRPFQHFTVHNEAVTSGGLTAYDWQRKVKKLLKKHHVHIAVIVLGTNDGQVLLQNGKRRISYKSEPWKAAYVQRVHNLMRLLDTRKVPTYWVGLPVMRRENMRDQVVMLNRFYEESAPLFAAVRFLPTRSLTVNEEGKYSAYLKVDGRKRLVRARDGIHFTVRGYDILADYTLKNIFDDFPFLNVLES
jgi:TPR repeat protein